MNSHIQDVIKIFKGQRFINTHPDEIAVFGKSLYYLVTTVLGARTLGEEYVDILYVTRLGKRFPRLPNRLLFTLAFIVVPYFVTRIARKMKVKSGEASTWLEKTFTSYPSLLDTIMNVHIALFYFQGLFYSISKRVFGLRYAFGHNKDPQKLQRTGNYSVLGGIMLLQFAVKMLISLNQYSKSQEAQARDQQESPENAAASGVISKLEQLEELQKLIEADTAVSDRVRVDLSDSKQLPYLPETSRSCMLCLSPMVDPSAANCGHLFCWECIVDWVRENPECPLCRQICLEQNLLPLR